MTKFIALSLCLAVSLTAQAAPIKKWVDEQGVTHYGTTIPPQYIRKEHSELNKQGVRTGHTGAAKTPEQIAKEKELARLRKEKQRLVEEQKARDRILLNMFRTDDDLIMLRDGKMAQIDAQIKLKQSQLKRQKNRLDKQQTHAANQERAGKQVSEQLLSNIEASRRQIENSYAAILNKEHEKERIQAKYNKDLKRLRELRHKPKNASAPSLEPSVDNAPASKDISGLHYCEIAHCDSAWDKAIKYAQQHTTTALSVASETIWIAKPAIANNDISITLARMEHTPSQQKIFLDLSCADSPTGKKLCASAAVKAIKSKFTNAIKN